MGYAAKMPSGRANNINFLKNVNPRSGSHTINDLDDYDLLLCSSFSKFYVMGTAERHLFGLAHVKVDIFGVHKMWVT